MCTRRDSHVFRAGGWAFLLAGAAVAALPSTSWGDPDWLKLRDRRPPYVGPGLKGHAVKVDPTSMMAQGFPAQGIVLQSWMPLNQFPGGQISAADIWGYVSPSGREYAIMGVRRGTVFVEVTDPVNPVLVPTGGYIAGSDSLWHDNTVIGNYAYLVSDQSGVGVQIADLSNIDSGIVTLAATRAPGSLSTTHTIVSNPASGFLYLCGTNINSGGLTALQTTAPASPTNPTIAGAWTTHYVHEAQVVTYTSGPYAGKEIAFCFTGGPYNNNNVTGLDIVDVTVKASMNLPASTLGSLAYSGIRFCHQGWLSEDRHYLYTDDELDEMNGTVSETTTRVIDVSVLSNPHVVASFSNHGTAVDHNLYVKGNMIFEGNYRSGLRVFDATNPLAPVEVAYLDTFPDNNNTNYNGVWGNYPFFPSGNVVVSDIERGLFVLRLDPTVATVTYPNGRPDTFAPGAPGEVIAQINTAGAGVDPASVELFASINGGPYAANAMISIGNARYRGTVPAASCGASIQWYVHASTTTGALISDPPIAPNDRYFARAASGVTTVFMDNMETDTGWTVGDPSSPDTATGGTWNRMRPQATTAQPGDDHTRTGTHACWVTNGNAGTSDNANDVDGGKTTVMTPVLNLAGMPEARVSYWRWYSNSLSTTFGTAGSDTFTVSVSNNGGTSWVVAETVGPLGAECAGDWFYHEFRVADFVAPTATVKVRFVANDLGTGSLVEACVDDFAAVSCQCTPVCRADWNRSGSVDPADVASFVNDWFQDLTAGTFAADFDGIGGVTPSDVAAFVSAWFTALTNGC